MEIDFTSVQASPIEAFEKTGAGGCKGVSITPLIILGIGILILIIINDKKNTDGKSETKINT